jgi:hypothetical protein
MHRTTHVAVHNFEWFSCSVRCPLWVGCSMLFSIIQDSHGLTPLSPTSFIPLTILLLANFETSSIPKCPNRQCQRCISDSSFATLIYSLPGMTFNMYSFPHISPIANNFEFLVILHNPLQNRQQVLP